MARPEIAKPLDLPFELDAGMFEHARAHGLAQIFEVVAGGGTGVDHEIAVHRRHLRAADHQAAPARLVDLLPGRRALGVLEESELGVGGKG